MKQHNSGLFPFVSVIVPVYNDEDRIRKCIEALIGQTYPSDRYEILVVDNGSTDNTPEVSMKYPVRFFIENLIQSSYAARNKGVRNATGEVIALTDSDCIPRSDWLENGVRHLLSRPDCGLVGGKISIFFKHEDCPNAVELYDSITGFSQKQDIEINHFGSTANVLTFKKVFDQVGLFNHFLKSGGDNEWGRRVFSHGYKQVYAEDVVVAHPARSSFKELIRRTVRLTGGCYEQYWKDSYSAYFRELLRTIKKVAAVTLRTLANRYPGAMLPGIRAKGQFISIFACVQLIAAFERTRLLMGKDPRR